MAFVFSHPKREGLLVFDGMSHSSVENEQTFESLRHGDGFLKFD